jgi:hypothetical protein
MLKVTIPNFNYVSAGLLKTLVMAAGMAPFKKPLDVNSEDVNTDGQPLDTGGEDMEFSPHEQWLGKPALTSLVIRLGGIEVTLAECIITVAQERNIISTALQGRDGTVKEYISDGDYEIEVSAAILPYAGGAADGSFTNVDDRYPLSELQDFMELLKEKGALEVQSDFLTLFGVHSAVVKSYSFAQETHSNRQAFTLALLSDEPYEIKLQQDA